MDKTELKYAALHITYFCENRCPYCYIGNRARDKHPPLEKVKKVIERLASNDIKEVLLVGGDPCSYPYLKEVVELIKKLGFKVYVLSNTLEFGKDLDFFINNSDDFQATILGSTENAHDEEAGRKGAYSKLIKNIKLLNEKGKKITVAISVHKQNYDKIFEIIKNLVENEKIKIKELVIQRVIPCGRAANTLSFSVTKEQVPAIFEQLNKIKQVFNLKIDFEDTFPLCIVPERLRYLQERACEWGFRKGSVNFNGDISRCGADGRFQLGNIFKIEKLQQFWKENPTLADFRSKNWLPDKCKGCIMLEKCRCGCPLSRVTNKDHECDILCSLR